MPTPTPPIHRKKIKETEDHAKPQPTEQANKKNEAVNSMIAAITQASVVTVQEIRARAMK